jgi:tyrosinase
MDHHPSFPARHWVVLSVVAGLLLFNACSGSCSRSRRFSGRVINQQGQPIPNASVDVSGARTTTSGTGEFQVSPAAQERFVLNITHPDYADLSFASRTPLVNQTWRLIRAQTSTVDPTTAITLTDMRPELTVKGLAGATLSLPPDSLVDQSGKPPAGQVRAAIATLDIANGEGPSDWAVRSDDGREEGYLVSYGAVHVQFTDPGGTVKYQLRAGRLADLTLPVIPNMLAHAPAAPSARFWYYDPRDGFWKGTGQAVLRADGKAYVGQINHLSTLNTDIAKFGNAACLKIDLDASVPLGNKLRIRYHSGGTPFGQTPQFVMNDTTNAAYRLPATTNVLLELLNASNEVFGNLVVEDPVGTSLVNTVVNTGPPIPQGGSLWPPPPFASCKPIRLRLEQPQVEIRINELSTDAAGIDDTPTDDYVTWAPTFGRVRLNSPMASPVTVVLTNDAPGAIAGGGDVQFAAHATPWPVNTTATNNTLTLTLPIDGSWVPFVVAGKFGTPSTNDKDTIIEAHMSTAAGAVLGRKALMVRVRKNANNLTPSERDRFLFAWRNFRNQLGSNYVLFQEMHRLASTAGDEAHKQPAFLSWHRVMLLHVERELQKIDPSVALHYWDWDAAAPNLFSANFIGAADQSVGPFSIAEPIFAASNPLNGWNTDLPFSGGELRRSGSDHTVFPNTMKPLDHPVDPDLVANASYGPRDLAPFSCGTASFSCEVEVDSHNPAHGWPCGGGHVTNPARSAADPLFYLLHSQIDRQWAYWQRQHNRHGVVNGGVLTFPAPAHYDNNGNWNDAGVTDWQKGSFLNDGLWPWDGTSGGPAGREQRPVNQATGPGTNVPLSTPLVPSTAFPASLRRNLWPAAASIPINAHSIDYFGKFRPQDGLGFCYVDVPY